MIWWVLLGMVNMDGGRWYSWEGEFGLRMGGIDGVVDMDGGMIVDMDAGGFGKYGCGGGEYGIFLEMRNRFRNLRI